MAIVDLLQKHENQVLAIKRRLYFLEAFETKLSELTREKTFKIQNDIIYHLAYDSWDMLVIDIASLCKDMLGRGGFFNQLKASTNQLKPAKRAQFVQPQGRVHYGPGAPPTAQERARHIHELNEQFLDMMEKHNKAAFFRLFPDAETRHNHKLVSKDIDKLKNKFELIARDLIDDRNKHRAHKYERKEIDRSIKKLGVHELEKKFDNLEHILNDLRLVSDLSSFEFNNMYMSSVNETSEDLVNLILFGSLKRIDQISGINQRLADQPEPEDDLRFGWNFRSKYLEKLHSRHEEFYSLHCYEKAMEMREKASYDSIKIEDVWFNDPRLDQVPYPFKKRE